MDKDQNPNEAAGPADATTNQPRPELLRSNSLSSFRQMLPAIVVPAQMPPINTSPGFEASDNSISATPLSPRHKIADASISTKKLSETVGSSPVPLRLGPSLSKNNINYARRSSRRGLTEPIFRAEPTLLHITEGVRRRVSSVLKFAGIDIDIETDKLKQLWTTFDSDGDGTIDYQEFCKYTCDLLEAQKKENGEAESLTLIEMRLIQLVTLEAKKSGSYDKAIEKIFRKLDQNRSGQLSLMEFMDGVRELGLLTYNFDVHGHKRRFANNSLFLLNTKNPFRYYLVWIVEWKWFDRFILLCIVANSIILAFRDYQDPGSITDADGTYYPNLRNSIVEKSETIFSWIFFAECVMKIVAMGFVLGRGAYLRSYWNQLDFFVVVVGFIGDLPGIPKVSALRTARVLRPLRTLSNLRGMRILIYALFSALPALFNVMVIIGFVFTVFGILGVLIWNGALHYRCRETPEPINGTWLLAGEGRLCGGQYKCAVGEYCGSVYSLPPNTTIDFSKLPPSESWDYKFSGFDNIGFALLTLFQSITLEGWTVVMYNFQDAHNWTFASLYFVTFTIIGAFFILQFVFAVIWERFNAVNDGTADNWDLILAERKSNTNTRTTTKLGKPPLQPRHLEERRMSQLGASFRNGISTTIVIVKQKNSTQRLRRACQKIVSGGYFTGFIVVCILLNTVCLAMDEYPVDPARTLVTENLNVVLTIIFSGEMAFKVIGLGPREYCSDNYNLFDGVIVLISLIELLFNFVNPDSKNNTGLSALRSFRFFRIMKLARSWRSLRELLVTIGNSILDVANFGLLLLLLMYVFALIGMQFFANKYRFNADGDPVEWQPHVFNTTTPPHAPWTPENPYTIRRSNFDDTLAAFTTVFQCLTEESWNFVMYDGVRSTGWGALLYFLAVMIIGNIIILNLFLAILLGNFSLDEQQTEMETAMIKGQQKLMDAIQIGPIRKLSSVFPLEIIQGGIIRRGSTNSTSPLPALPEPRPPLVHQTTPPKKARFRRRSSSCTMSRRQHEDLFEEESNVNPSPVAEDSPNNSRRELSSSPSRDLSSIPSNISPVPIPARRSVTTNVGINPETSRQGDSRASVSDMTSVLAANKQVQFRRLSVASASGVNKSDTAMTEVIVADRDRSLFVFKKSSVVRSICHYISRSSYFEHLILAIIFVGSILLAVDNPLNDPKSRQSIILGITDTVFTSIFVVEMTLKVIDLGFIFNGSQSYLRDPWNVLDFAILVFAGAKLFSSNKTLRSLRSVRTLRALRPLRFISRVPGMKRVVNALLSSIPSIMNVFLVCSLIFLIFGIIGVNLFKGRLYYCDMSTFPEEQLQRLESTYGFSKLSFKKLFSKADCLDEGGVWVLRNRNYNNVLKSAMTLFELGTTEGWVDIMYEGVDATEIDHHPVENYNRSYVIFFIVFIIIGSFFTLNLFVGAVIDNFNRMHESLEFSGAQNETQREWLQIQDMVRSTKLKFTVIEPHHPLRRVCYYIQQHPSFEAFVAFCVLANTIMLGITHFQESDTVVEVLSVGNLLFCVVFFLEAVVKLMSMGSKYFQDRWNIFDFLVVGGSSVSTALPFFTKGKISPVANTVRALRMGLAIRLMKRAKSMQDIVSTILENMPALINVSTLMFLVMFVYAVIGVQIYAEVKLGENLDEHANFKDISTAMLTLFRFTTGEAWNDVMYDLMVEPIKGAAPYPFGVSCVEDYSYDMLLDARAFMGDATLTIGCTPGVQVTYVYFLSYMLVTTYVLLNLFVAVILEGFEEATERHSSAVRKEDLTHVARIWQGFDASASGYISDHAFLKFLRYVPPPLGLPKHSQRKEVEQWAMQLNLYLEHGNSISFNAFLMAAAQNVMNKVSVDHGEPIEVPKGTTSLFAISQKLVWRITKPQQVRRLSLANAPSLIAIISAKRIQAAARKDLARRRFAELKRKADENAGIFAATSTPSGVIADISSKIVQSMKVAPVPDGGPLLIADTVQSIAEHGEESDSVRTMSSASDK